MKPETKDYPAPLLAHWATGPVPCCEDHAAGLVKLGNFMGAHVAVTPNPNMGEQCTNCVNENK